MEETTTVVTAEVYLDTYEGYSSGYVTWSDPVNETLVKQFETIQESNEQLQTSIDNLLFAVLFLVAVLGVRVGQGFVQIFKTR